MNSFTDLNDQISQSNKLQLDRTPQAKARLLDSLTNKIISKVAAQ